MMYVWESCTKINKKRCKRVTQYIGTVTLLSLLLVTSFGLPVLGYNFIKLNIQKIDSFPWGYEIHIGNESFFVSKYPVHATYNFTWHNRNNKTFSFIADWANELEIIPVLRNDFNLTAWNEKTIVEEGEFYPYSHDCVLGKDSHTFLARYNGSFFEELLIYGHSSLIVDNLYGDRWNYTEHELYDFYEYNHTTVAKANSTAVIYNPTYIMYTAKIYLVTNYQDINRTEVGFYYVFLVPQSLLPDRYANYSYLWVLSSWAGIRKDSSLLQTNYTNAPEKPFGFASYLLMDLNGNVVLDITKPVYYITPPCDNCSNPEYRFSMFVEIAVAVSVVIVLPALIVVKLKRRKEKGRKKT